MSMKKQWIIPVLIVWGLQPIKPIHAQETVATLVQQVSVDSLMLTVAHLSGHESYSLNGQTDSMWTRYMYGAQINKARDYLKYRLERYGYEVTLEAFSVVGKASPNTGALCQGWPPTETPQKEQSSPSPIAKPAATLYNVIAEKTGTLYPDEYYLIGGHYDSIVWYDYDPSYAYTYAPGADDNASGVAAVLEAARILAPIELPYSVRFILFSGEEHGLYGSRHHANAAYSNNEQILGVINIDMIAYHNGTASRVNTQIHANALSQTLGRFVADGASGWGITGTYPWLMDPSQSLTSSDHSPFWERGYTAVFLTEDWYWSRNPYYHQITDTYESLNTAYFLENAKLAIAALADLAGLEQNTAVAETPFQPQGFVFEAPYPNPFNPTVTLPYTAAGQAKVRISVFNLLGQEVTVLQDGPSSAGDHDLVWDGRDKSGEIVPSGVYLVVAESGGARYTRKIVFQK